MGTEITVREPASCEPTPLWSLKASSLSHHISPAHLNACKTDTDLYRERLISQEKELAKLKEELRG